MSVCAVTHDLNRHLAAVDSSEKANEYASEQLDQLLKLESIAPIGDLELILAESGSDALFSSIAKLASALHCGSQEEKEEALIVFQNTVSEIANDELASNSEEIYEHHQSHLEEEAATARYESQLDDCVGW